MIIDFLKVDTNNGIEYFSYETLFETLKEDELQKIFMKWHEKKFKLVCTCNNEKSIDMLMRKGTKNNSNKYVLATAQNQSKYHES